MNSSFITSRPASAVATVFEKGSFEVRCVTQSFNGVSIDMGLDQSYIWNTNLEVTNSQ